MKCNGMGQVRARSDVFRAQGSVNETVKGLAKVDKSQRNRTSQGRGEREAYEARARAGRTKVLAQRRSRLS